MAVDLCMALNVTLTLKAMVRHDPLVDILLFAKTERGCVFSGTVQLTRVPSDNHTLNASVTMTFPLTGLIGQNDLFVRSSLCRRQNLPTNVHIVLSSPC